jgi:PEP-CTERM motif/Lectin C-type domain
MMSMTRRFMLAAAVLGLGAVMAGKRADAAPVVNLSNGNYYDVIDGIYTWDAANAAAAGSSYLGLSGHLVTITSASENRFLTDTFGGSALELHWTGGFQPVGSSEPGGGWSWVTAEAFTFNNWAGGEPNNSNGEDKIEFFYSSSANADGAVWNDLSNSDTTFVRGYVVEYEAAAIPEPSSVAMAGLMTLAGLGYAWRRKRAA